MPVSSRHCRELEGALWQAAVDLSHDIGGEHDEQHAPPTRQAHPEELESLGGGPSADNLRQFRWFSKGGYGSSGLELRGLQVMLQASGLERFALDSAGAGRGLSRHDRRARSGRHNP